MISCAEAVRRLWDYIERELPPDAEERIEEHIAVCRQCCGEAEFAGQLRGFLTTHARPEMPEDAGQRLETFLAALDPADGATP